jgi:hypothetical protein
MVIVCVFAYFMLFCLSHIFSKVGVAEEDLKELLGLWVELEVYSAAMVVSEEQAEAAQAALRAQFADLEACQRFTKELGLQAAGGRVGTGCACDSNACPANAQTDTSAVKARGQPAPQPQSQLRQLPPSQLERRLKAGAVFDTNKLNCASLLTGTH